MSLLSDAIERLGKYNLGPFNILSNAFGLTGAGGPDTNLEPMLGDVATVGQASVDNAQAAAQSASSAATARDIVLGAIADANAANDLALTYRDDAEEFRDQAQVAAASLNLPSITIADAGKALIVKPDGSGYVTGQGGLPAATNAETATGTATDKAVTPAGAVATFLKFAGGTLTGLLQTYAGVDKDTLGLRIGEATSGFYRSAAGVLGFVVGGVEVFRTAATGVLNFFKGITCSLVTLTATSNTFTPDCAAGNEFECVTTAGGSTITANSTIANPINVPAAGRVQSLSIKWTQDGTGGRTMSFGNLCINIGGASANTAAGKTNFAIGKVYPDGKFYYSIVKAN